MRAAMIAVVFLAACGVDEVDTGGSRSIVVEQPDGSGSSEQIPGPYYEDSCDQLLPDDDKNCELACTDWFAFAALATPGNCAHALCPLADGRTFAPSVCLDPKP